MRPITAGDMMFRGDAFDRYARKNRNFFTSSRCNHQ